jgi:monoamine oxidase
MGFSPMIMMGTLMSARPSDGYHVGALLMARTPLARALRAITDQIQTEAAETSPGPSRRSVLAGGAALVAGAGLPLGVAAATPAAAAPAGGGTPRIVVVGAGLAGLTTAYRLRNAGYASTVVEAADRVGGRCWSIRDYFAEGQVAEHGGELIDQSHAAVRQLAQELGLKLDNLLAAEQKGTEPIYWFDGAPYTYAQATADIKLIWQQLHNDVSAASYPTLYNSYTPRGLELDRMSITDYIARYVTPKSSRLGQLLDVAYNIEYGGECSVQSSLNMLYLLAYSGQGQLRIFGPSNEKYHVVGGNDQIPTRLESLLTPQIKLGTRLVALADNQDGTWTVTTKTGSRTSSQVADRVVLTLPFSLLRQVDLTRAGFTGPKALAINELPMGTNSKLQLQFTDRHWRSLGGNGDSYSDTGYQSTWEVTRAQPGKSGILVDYTGGTIGGSYGNQPAATYAATFLTQIEPLFPGITKKWNGRATLDFWKTYPWTLGSYSYWKVGQYTRFSGAEKEAVGSCHFAGEHTSQDFQGYLNGAVESGNRAASEVLAALK